MSSETPEKQGVNRHRAREAAIQLLFAFDLVGKDHLSSDGYWSGFGYDQLEDNATKKVQSVVTDIENIGKTVVQLRDKIRVFDNLERKSSRVERAKELESRVDRTLRSFSIYVNSAIEKGTADFFPVKNNLSEMVDDVRSLTADLEFFFAERQNRHLRDETKECTALIERITDQINRAKNSFAVAGQLFPRLENSREYAAFLAFQTIEKLGEIDETIKKRAEHWRIERMALVDRNIIRLAVFEMMFTDTPGTVVINEALELARQYSTYESTQFINGILDAIRTDIEADSDSQSAPAALGS